ncbi:MAG TPA: 3-hydroxyacyl-CoA dehydrogenase NAD-binding domain-containing protein [Roseiarcus sp.]|jgi:3-hydroxyacyl-CoA dehydrogenase/enoyl-CoA hydratase/3-hydroxybutyryl-CoA epimerase
MPFISTPESPTAKARRVGIVGPGLMGLGIAQAVAASGSTVVLCGRNAEAAQAGCRRLAAAIERQVARGRIEGAVAAGILARVEAAESDEALAGCEFAIESVSEDRETKTRVLRRIEATAPRRALIASNTSGLAISGLAKALDDPGRFLGLHFFSPAERMALVEVVRGEATKPACVRSAVAFVDEIGKRPVLVRDGPGFFATRVFAAYLDEALALLSESVAPERIEAAAIANGRALGPLAMLDETGLTLNLQQARQARADGLEPRFCRPLAEPALARMAQLGRRGRRDGGGFFDWPAEGPRTAWPGLAGAFPLRVDQPSAEAVKLRLLCAEAREALRCLEEGVIASADDGDAASMLGLGFPKRVGGILRWAEDFGLAAFVMACDSLARDSGARFTPTPWLRDLAERGEGLAPWRAESKLRSDA